MVVRRREFIFLVGTGAGAALLRSRVLGAQPSPIRPLVGVLSPLSITAAARNVAALLVVPGLVRVAALFNPDDPNDRVQRKRLLAAAPALGVTIQIFEVRDLSKLEDLAGEITRANVHGLVIGMSPFFLSSPSQITAMASRLKLPTVYFWREFADAGGLMSYGCNLPEMYRQSGRLVGKILKGEKPGDLAFELPSRYELIVNLKTAKSMGIHIAEVFHVLADELIE